MQFTANIGVRITLLNKPDLTVPDVVVTTRTQPVETRIAAQQETALALLDIHEQLATCLSEHAMGLVNPAIVQVLAALQRPVDTAREGQLVYSDQNDTHEITTNVYFSQAREPADARF